MEIKAKPPSNPPDSGAYPKVPGTQITWGTIRVIVLTTAVVFVLLSIPFFFIIKTFVKFDDVDNYFGVTKGVSPKILGKISEELEAGYSKNFSITSSTESDRSLIFGSEPGQRVTLFLDVQAFRDSTVQQIQLQLNGHCLIPRDGGFTQVKYDLSRDLATCPGEGPFKLNRLVIVLPGGPKRDGRLDVNMLVLVYEKVHDPAPVAAQEPGEAKK